MSNPWPAAYLLDWNHTMQTNVLQAARSTDRIPRPNELTSVSISDAIDKAPVSLAHPLGRAATDRAPIPSLPSQIPRSTAILSSWITRVVDLRNHRQGRCGRG